MSDVLEKPISPHIEIEFTGHTETTSLVEENRQVSSEDAKFPAVLDPYNRQDSSFGPSGDDKHKPDKVQEGRTDSALKPKELDDDSRENSSLSEGCLENIKKFLATHYLWVGAAIAILVGLAVVIAFTVIGKDAHSCSTNTEKIIGMLNDESVAYKQDKAAQEALQLEVRELQQRLDAAQLKIKEMNGAIPSDLCPDVSSSSSPIPIVKCNVTACKKQTVVGRPTTFYAPSTNTSWFPELCDDSVIADLPKVTSDNAHPDELSLVTRRHPTCNGKMQFQGSCAGAHPKTEAVARDCSTTYLLCPKLK